MKSRKDHCNRIICVVALLGGFNSLAGSCDEQALTQLKSITLSDSAVRIEATALTANWQANCDRRKYGYTSDLTDEKINQYFKKMVVDGAVDGLVKINTLNPELYKDILNRMKNKKISVSCDEHSLGETNKYFNTGKIKIGSAILSQYVDMQKLVDAGNTIAQTPSGPGTVFFHEFLHASQLDNRSMKEHNSLRASSDGDVIYACMDPAASMNACIVCTLANRGSGKVALDISKFGSAKQNCESYLKKRDPDASLFTTVTPENLKNP